MSNRTQRIPDYLQHILDEVNRIAEFIKDSQEDEKTYYAVMRSLEIIGEATKRIPIDIRDEHPDVPWKQMAALRDVLIHDYDGLLIDSIWDTAKRDIPALKAPIERIINEIKE